MLFLPSFFFFFAVCEPDADYHKKGKNGSNCRTSSTFDYGLQINK